ncbi:MAG: UDP-N-acetylglucosamine 2-epimerase (non-hydrolyzing) [Planctomycetes bacterium]|nr:UDP-N-acetylglucosamine 2-epimerase (non-hydrolyzing) [Planctomycetota bacterium]
MLRQGEGGVVFAHDVRREVQGVEHPAHEEKAQLARGEPLHRRRSTKVGGLPHRYHGGPAHQEEAGQKCRSTPCSGRKGRGIFVPVPTETPCRKPRERLGLDIAIVIGARPNFMKAAPVLHALRERRGVRVSLVHTGQHYDEAMSGSFLRDLDLQAPGVNLGVGSGTHGRQTGEVLARFEGWLEANPQDLVMVFGDVNSTLAAALAAVKRHVPVAHVEAGLRSGDRKMPEEINRIATDTIASLLFVTEPSGLRHLEREGIDASRVHHVGNTMIDTLKRFEERARGQALPSGTPERFGVVTLHRPSNVDDRDTLRGILEAFLTVSKDLPLLWPMHPRTRQRLEDFDLADGLGRTGDVRVLPPSQYIDFIGLCAHAALVLTDSGGIQEEALVLRVPVVTLRENTERPITVEAGGNLLVGSDPQRIRDGVSEMRGRDPSTFRVPALWDGHAGERIATIVVDRLAAGLPL